MGYTEDRIVGGQTQSDNSPPDVEGERSNPEENDDDSKSLDINQVASAINDEENGDKQEEV